MAENLDIDEWVVNATSALREARQRRRSRRPDRGRNRRRHHCHQRPRRGEADLRRGARQRADRRPPAVCIDQGGGSFESLGRRQHGPRMGYQRQARRGAPHRRARVTRTRRPRLTSNGCVTAPRRCSPRSRAACERNRPGMFDRDERHAHLTGRDWRHRSWRGNAQLVASTHRQRRGSRTDPRTRADQLARRAHARCHGLDARRAEIIPAGSVVLQVAMELFGFEELTVSEWSMREGMVLDAIGHHEAFEWVDPRSMRRESVHALVRRYGANDAHAHQVAWFAPALFDDTASLHELDADDRELLEHAAWLHDIGEHIAMDNHDRHTAYLIEHGQLLGFSPEEVLMLAAIGRFHRKGTPKPSSYEPLRQLDDETPRTRHAPHRAAAYRRRPRPWPQRRRRRPHDHRARHRGRTHRRGRATPTSSAGACAASAACSRRASGSLSSSPTPTNRSGDVQSCCLQAVVATSSLNRSAGVSHPRVSRGRPLRSAAK